MQPRSASRCPALYREPVGARWPSVWFKPCHRRPSRHRVGRFRSVGQVEETVTNPSTRGAWSSSASMSGSTYIDVCPNHHAKPAPIPGRHGGHRTDNWWRSAGARIQAAGWARVRALGCAPAQLTAAALDGSALGSRVLVVRLGQASRCAVASRTDRSGLRFGRLRSSRLSRQRLVDPVLSPARPLSQEKPQPESTQLEDFLDAVCPHLLSSAGPSYDLAHLPGQLLFSRFVSLNSSLLPGFACLLNLSLQGKNLSSEF